MRCLCPGHRTHQITSFRSDIVIRAFDIRLAPQRETTLSGTAPRCLSPYAAGLRISETVALQIPDIKPDKQLLHIRSAKGGTERMVPLPRGELEYLHSYWRNICPRPVT